MNIGWPLIALWSIVATVVAVVQSIRLERDRHALQEERESHEWWHKKYNESIEARSALFKKLEAVEKALRGE